MSSLRRGWLRRGSLRQSYSLRWAEPSGLFDPCSVLITRFFDQDVEVSIVSDFEHFGGCAHTQRVALATIEIDRNFHVDLQSFRDNGIHANDFGASSEQGSDFWAECFHSVGAAVET
jgi:hypothetical protein